MNTDLLRCTKCGTPLPAETFNPVDLMNCPSCGRFLRVEVFPALFRENAVGQDGEALLTDSEASCFYHPQKKAVVACESCGRFLCALCDVEFHSQHLCPACIETGDKKGRIKSLEKGRLLYDDVAMGAAVLPLLFWPVTLLSAPIALFIAIRYWKAPSSVIPRSKLRMLLAMLFASLQILGWGALLYGFANH